MPIQSVSNLGVSPSQLKATETFVGASRRPALEYEFHEQIPPLHTIHQFGGGSFSLGNSDGVSRVPQSVLNVAKRIIFTAIVLVAVPIDGLNALIGDETGKH